MEAAAEAAAAAAALGAAAAEQDLCLNIFLPLIETIFKDEIT